jgi:hypothetical protein
MLWCVRVFFRPLVTSVSQVVQGRPTGRLVGVMKYWRALWAGVLGSSRRMWPKSERRLFLIFLLMGVSFVIL